MMPIFGATIKVIVGFYLGCVGNLTAPHQAYTDIFEVKLLCSYKDVKGDLVGQEVDVVLNREQFEIVNEPRK